MATPTGKLIRNPQVLNAMGTSTIAAPSQQAVTTAVADAKKAGTDAQSTANTANSTANDAKTAAATADGKAVAAQTAANSAKSTADTAVANAKTAQTAADDAKTAAATADGKAVAAQTAATNANNNANNRVPTHRKVNGKALTADISLSAADVGALTQATADGRYMLKTASTGVTLGAVEVVVSGEATTVDSSTPWLFATSTGGGAYERSRLPDLCVVTNFGTKRLGDTKDKFYYRVFFRRITGGV